MKLYKALKKGQVKTGQTPAPPPVETDKITTLKCHCMVCSKETGLTKDIRATLIDPKDLKEAGVEEDMTGRIRDGMCESCSNAVAKGHTILINQSGTKSAILSLEANEKLVEEARGKVISIPDDKMEEMLEGAKE